MIEEKSLNMNNILHEHIIMPNSELSIFFIEHIYNSTGPYCIKHWHDEIEFVYVARGIILATCNANTITAEPGDIIFVNSKEFHDYSVVKAPILLYCAVVDSSLLQGRYLNSYETQYISASEKVAVFENYIQNSEPMKKLFLSMWSENEKKMLGYEYAIKSNLYGIFSLLIRSYMKYTITSEQNSHKTQNVEKINKVIKYIESHYQEDISLDEMAKILNFNRYYFCRFFKKVTGVTPTDYIRDFRIHQAMSIISDCPDLLVTNIASRCGFSDPNYFTRLFRSITGFTPSCYKANCQANIGVNNIASLQDKQFQV